MIQAIVMVPVLDNDGKPFDRRLRPELEARFVALAGGAGITAGVRGLWQGAGRTYQDTNNRYDVWLSGWWQAPAFLDLVRWIQDTFDQEAIGIVVAGVPEVVTFR